MWNWLGSWLRSWLGLNWDSLLEAGALRCLSAGNLTVGTGLLGCDDADWNLTALGGALLAVGLVRSAVEHSVELVGDVLTGATDWPWIGVVGIAAALSKLLGSGDRTVGQGHAVLLLVLRQHDRLLRDDSERRAVVDWRAVHGSSAGRRDDWRRLILLDDD